MTKEQLAPDCQNLHVGSENGYEYELRGYFSGDKVYKLVSNRFLPEFVLKGYKLISTNPAPIFPAEIRANRGNYFEIEQPE